MFSVDKVVNSVSVAGVTQKEAEAIGALVQEWARKTASDNIISSIQIRDKVLELLKAIDPSSAQAFSAYRG